MIHSGVDMWSIFLAGQVNWKKKDRMRARLKTIGIGQASGPRDEERRKETRLIEAVLTKNVQLMLMIQCVESGKAVSIEPLSRRIVCFDRMMSIYIL